MADRVIYENGIRRTYREDASGGLSPVFASDSSDVWSAAVQAGRGFILGSGRVTLTVAGNLRGLVRNPTGSGKTVSVVGLASFVTAVAYAEMLLDPTTGVPATAPRPALRLNPNAGTAHVTELLVDTDATVPLGGGTPTGVVLGMPASQRTEIGRLGRVLLPGQTFGINVPFAGSADAAFSVYVVETPLA